MNINFYNLPAFGHINPTLGVVKSLVDRGIDVTYYAGEAFRHHVERCGATFIGYPPAVDIDMRAASNNYVTLIRTILEASFSMLDRMVADLDKNRPDLIVHDSLTYWGRALAEISGIPAAATVGTFAFSGAGRRQVAPKLSARIAKMAALAVGDMARIVQLRRAIAGRYGVKAPGFFSLFSNEERLNIVFTVREIQPRGDAFRDRYHFVGPSIRPYEDADDFPFDRISPSGMILVSLGTIANDRPDLFRAAAAAFEEFEQTVVLAVGRKDVADALGEMPPNVIVSTDIPQLSLLERCTLFVTHGGMNSVHEALYHGVPLLLVPQTAEQQLVASRVEELGAGVVLSEGEAVDPGAIRATARRVLADGTCARRAEDLGGLFRRAGGADTAADLIETLARQEMFHR